MEHTDDTPLPLPGTQRVTTTNRAAWLATELRRLYSTRDEQLEPIVEEIKRLQDLVYDINEHFAGDVACRTEELRAWHTNKLAEDPKTPKTWPFPGGTSKVTEPKPRVAVTDDTEFIAFALEQGLDDDVLRVKTEVAKAAVKTMFGSLAETTSVERGKSAPTDIPGLVVEWPERTASFKPAE